MGQSDIDKYIFYKMLDAKKNISLVKLAGTGKTFVKKVYKNYNREVFETLKSCDIARIPKIMELEENIGELYCIEEYIKGDNLLEIFNHNGELSEKEVLNIMLQICDILKKLHALNPPIIHRDIKPSNIIKTAGNVYYLIDFNASKIENRDMCEDTVLAGTRYFAAPEQLTGYGVSDVRTDIFGMGATMNYLLTGMMFNQMIAFGKFESIIKKCTSLDMNNRYQSIEELENSLKSIIF